MLVDFRGAFSLPGWRADVVLAGQLLGVEFCLRKGAGFDIIGAFDVTPNEGVRYDHRRVAKQFERKG